MAEIRPFKGVLYNEDLITNLSLVIAPPYDVISSTEQEQLYERNAYNIVRLIKGKEFPEDNGKDNTYTRANQYFQNWLREKLLVEDLNEAIYACQDEYKLQDDTRKIRKGFFALFRLEDFGSGSIYPHERTLAGPKESRFRLMQACSANFSPIFSLYSDTERKVEQVMDDVFSSPPDIRILSQERILHRLWKITDPVSCGIIVEAMKGQKIFIADGHHRYETALNYQKFMREKNGLRDKKQPYDYCLMYFANTDDEGLSILPYHRAVRNLSWEVLDNLEARLKPWFYIKSFHFDGIAINEATARKDLTMQMARMGVNRPVFGLYMGKHRYFLLALKHDVNIEEIVAGEGSKAWKRLDVNVLHALILEKILGISSNDFEKKETLVFEADTVKAISLVNMNTCQAAILVNPTKIEQVKKVALKGEKMPQKSTFFYPKLPSGLIIRRI
ncbi:MAG: DUF1015 domain-containing protein [bacterium]